MKFNSHKTKIALLVSALCVPFAANATNGYFSHAYSTNSSGLAGAGVALPQDAMASATNPAGMVWVGQKMDVGAALFSPLRQYTITGNPSGGMGTFGLAPGTIKSDSNYFLIPHFGANWILDADSTIGLAIYGNGGMNTDYPAFNNAYCGGPATGTFCAGATGVNLEQLFINGSYSRKINATSSWGVSVIGAYQKFKATGVGSFAGYSADASNLSDNGDDTSTGFGAKIGWQGEVTAGLTLGVSYQTKTSMSKFKKYAGLFAEQGSFDIPATATIGLAYKASPQSTVVFDVQQIEYSKIPSIANPLLPNLATSQLGNSDGAGFGWKDMTIYKIGYQWATSPDWTWRVGFSMGDQPIPKSELMFNILAPAVMEQHLTFGFTNKLSPTSEWNFAAMYAPSKSVTGPNPLDAPNQQTIELKMYQYQVEASYSWKF